MHRLFHKVPCLRPFLAYLAGLLCGVATLKPVLSCLIVAGWLLLLHRWFDRHLPSPWSVRWMTGVAVCYCWVGLGMWSGYAAWRKTELPITPFEGRQFNCLAEVLVPPVEKNKSWQLGVSLEQVPVSDWLHRKLIVYVPKQACVASLKSGDRLTMVVSPQPFSSQQAAEFDYARWMRVKGYTASSYVGVWRKVDDAPWWNLKALAAKMAARLVGIVDRAHLSDEGNALLVAMTLGARESLSAERKAEFAVAGVTHILSVSGLHVGVIYALLRYSFFFMGYSTRAKRWRDGLIVALLWVFALVTGLSPSVCRAVTMVSLLLVGGIMGRSTSTLNTVFFSAWLLLLINPLLIFDVGFQLSYVAVLGLVVIYPLVYRLWKPESHIIRQAWGLMAVSLVAQMTTAPLTVHYFGQFPTYFLVANLIAVPLSGVLIYVSVLMWIVSPIKLLFDVVVACLSFCVQLFLDVVQLVSRWPHSVSTDLVLPVDQILLLYGLMCLMVGWLVWKRRSWLLAGLVCVVVLQGDVLIRQFLVQIPC